MSDYKDLRNIGTDQKDKVRSEMEKARAAAKAARAEMTALRESANDENVDLSPEGEAFKKLTEASRAYSEAKQAADEMEFVYKSLIDIDGEIAGGKVKDAEAKARSEETVESRKAQSIAVRAVDKFMQAPQYQSIREQLKSWTPGDPVPRFKTDDVIDRNSLARLIGFRAAGDNTVTGLSDTSAGAMVWPEQDGRIVDLKPFRAPRVLDVVNTTTTDSDAVEYVTITGKTNNAAATLEATNGSDGALPESAMTFAVASVIVENIGHYIPVTARALADAGQLDNIIRTFLIEGVRVALEGEILSGDGSTPNLAGIYTDVTQTQAVGVDSRSDAVLKAQTAIRVNAAINDTVMPDAIVLHPNDYQDLRLEKDDNGNYIYGGPTAPAAFPVWGMTPVQALGATSGTPIVGDFRFAQLWLRSGVSVAVSDSHDDWFISNILTMKAQLRAAFKATRIAAFCEITGF